MRQDHRHGLRYKRGYKLCVPASVKTRLKELGNTCLACSTGWAAAYVSSIALIAGSTIAIVAFAYMMNVPAFVVIFASPVLYAVSVVSIARQQRGLELMVHDASHGAWDQEDAKRNNLFANRIVGYPVLMTVESYWNSHHTHHGRYGSELDPCRLRFAKMGLGHIDLSSRLKIARAVVRWLPSYNAAFYKEIGSFSATVWLRYIGWHSTVFVAPATTAFVVLGISFPAAIVASLAAWLAFWMVPMMTTLPVIRSIAESEEHDYGRDETEFGTTFTNIGWCHTLLIHPWNDEYHLIHHMFPAMPQRVHHKAHVLLSEHDVAYRGSPQRTTILRKP